MWTNLGGVWTQLMKVRGGMHLLSHDVRSTQYPPKHVYGTFPYGGEGGGGHIFWLMVGFIDLYSYGPNILKEVGKISFSGGG